MGLLVECPQCRYRNSVKASACKKCGLDLRRAKGKVYWIEYYDLQHRRRRERIGPNRQIAEMRLAEVKRQLVEGKYVPEAWLGSMLFSEFWEKHYVPWVSSVNSSRWVQRKQEIYRLHLAPVFGSRKLKDITRAEVEAYMRQRLEEGAAPATVNREVAVLKHALGKAVEWKQAVSNPAAGIKMFREKDDAWQVIPREDWEKILQHLPERMRPLFQFLWTTGVRLSNALYLTWDQVDLKNKLLRIPSSSTKQRKELFLPLPDDLVDLLVSIRVDTTHVFVNSRRKPWDRHQVHQAWRKALKKAGTRKYRIHDIRHTFGARAVRAGLDVRIVQELLGHQTLQMVLRYTHVDLSTLREAMQRMNRL